MGGLHLVIKKRINKVIERVRIVADALDDADKAEFKKADLIRRSRDYAGLLHQAMNELSILIGKQKP